MKVIFDKLAKEELSDEIEYYEIEIEGLGGKFKEEVKRVINIISKIPQIGSPESNNIRKYILHKFPYKILYSVAMCYASNFAQSDQPNLTRI
ncbi:type II toxin-antitoxin system RelE/ParE family toxin [Candidatus Poribacteria bacterium]|nr:type II toxin-antitoxin system RelE/ParE family toxin [Candidatus Poribacteria bacterium]